MVRKAWPDLESSAPLKKNTGSKYENVNCLKALWECTCWCASSKKKKKKILIVALHKDADLEKYMYVNQSTTIFFFEEHTQLKKKIKTNSQNMINVPLETFFISLTGCKYGKPVRDTGKVFVCDKITGCGGSQPLQSKRSSLPFETNVYTL